MVVRRSIFYVIVLAAFLCSLLAFAFPALGMKVLTSLLIPGSR
jgi:hypothetical protein